MSAAAQGPPPTWLGDCYREMIETFDGVNADHRLMLFKRLGISGQAIVNSGGPILTGRVRALRDGNRFEPVPAGENGIAVVLAPVIDDSGALATGGAVVDLIAFQPGQPERWRLRTGDGVILGTAAVELAKFNEAPLTLFPTPLQWLRGECAGAVVLDWGPRLFFRISGPMRVICTDAKIAQRLADAERQAAPPQINIRVKEPARVAA